jgi:hypothetical protein
MALTLKDRRLRAHAQQGGLCFYCCLPVCEGNLQSFRRRYGLTAREAESLLSTAEHLVARKDGGTDGNSNVVARIRGRPRDASLYRPDPQRAVSRVDDQTLPVMARS